MQKRWLAMLVWLLGALVLAGSCFAGHGDKRPMKKAILIAAFGTSVPEAQQALDQVDVKVRKSFPDVEVRWAYTSKIIRKKLAQQGKIYDSPETALAKLMDDGYTHVAVLPLHTIPGREFHELSQNAHLFGQMADGFQSILVAYPLLSSHEDMTQVAKAMLQHIPRERKADEAVVLMGHGTEHHPADAIYLAMNQVFQEGDRNVFVATVEGYPTLDDVLPKLREQKVKTVYLMPFMAVAGDHARNDMAGTEPDSWKSNLEKNGYNVKVVLKGTAEYPEVVDVWVKHLQSAYSHFE